MNTRHTLPLLGFLTTLGLASSAQTSFDHDRLISPAFAPPGILTEAFPGLPVVAIPAAAMGLGPLDEIDALSYGDDFIIQTVHTIVFSVDFVAVGAPGSGTAFEVGVDTAPGAPPAAAGDIFVQSPVAAVGNLLAPAGSGYAAGTTTGDEANAAWPTPCIPGAICADVDAFDYGNPVLATGVYFSLAPGSPTLGAIGATPGDILYSDLLGGPPIIAMLAGLAPATDVNLGIPGLNLDALNCVGSTGPIGAGGGVIAPGVVGPSVAGIVPSPSTHLLEYSVSFAGFDADVLELGGLGIAVVHTPAPALGLLPHENLNALEVTQPLGPGCPPTAATLVHYNGSGINRDILTASKVVVGSPWTATLTPQPLRGPGAWIILMRTATSAGPILDLGPIFALPPAGLSELLVGGGVIANFFPPAHGGAGTATTFSIGVPPNCALVGMSWAAQSIVFGNLPIGPGILDPWFSSAARGTIGTF